MNATRRRFYPRLPATTSTDLSETRPDPGLQKKEPSWERRRRENEGQAAQGMAALNQMVEHLGGLLSIAQATPVNDIMYSGARTIPASGVDLIEFKQAHSSVTIANLSASLLTVGRIGTTTSPASVGAGVVRIPPGIQRTFAGRGNGVSVAGQPGSTYDLTVFIRPRPPQSGPSSRAQGSALIAAGATTSQTVTFAGSNLAHIAAVLNVSAVTGGTVQVTLNGVTPSGYVYPLLVGLAVTAVGVTPYRVGPGLTPSTNAVANDLVPELVQAVVTVTGTITYGLDLVAG